MWWHFTRPIGPRSADLRERCDATAERWFEGASGRCFEGSLARHATPSVAATHRARHGREPGRPSRVGMMRGEPRPRCDRCPGCLLRCRRDHDEGCADAYAGATEQEKRPRATRSLAHLRDPPVTSVSAGQRPFISSGERASVVDVGGMWACVVHDQSRMWADGRGTSGSRALIEGRPGGRACDARHETDAPQGRVPTRWPSSGRPLRGRCACTSVSTERAGSRRPRRRGSR